MTVKELIAELSKAPPDLVVFIQDNNTGERYGLQCVQHEPEEGQYLLGDPRVTQYPLLVSEE